MQFKDILVHLDDSPQCAARFALAVGLARKQKAHLTGLYVISHPGDQPLHESAITASQAQAEFEHQAGQSGISADWLCVDWRVKGLSLADILTLHAHYNDLVIVGQTDNTFKGNGFRLDMRRLVMASGRPVLIVPYAGRFHTVGEQVMVAWKPGRESVRALNDAMPFMLNACKVSVLSVISSQLGDGANAESCARICTYLSHHDISAKADQIMAGDIPVGDVFLNHAWEKGCDLLVMGAYSHNPREPLGPVAAHVLSCMTMPVLISH